VTIEQSWVSGLIEKSGSKIVHKLLAVGAGVVILAAVAQIAIPLPFTPVPITGQTFAVALISLLWGRARGVSVVIIYLGLGFGGLPIFASGKVGSFGPTTGYLLGMIMASYVMGGLADRGWTKNFWHTWAAAVIGSVCTFAIGLLVLSFYVPKEGLLIQGILPFLPGDFVKSSLASFIVWQTARTA